VRQTRDTVAEGLAHGLPVAEKACGTALTGADHLVSVFGGDPGSGALAAAIADEQRLDQLARRGRLFGHLGEKPMMYGIIQIPGRKRPARHLAAVSPDTIGTTLGDDGQRARKQFSPTGARVSANTGVRYPHTRFGLPAMPAWASGCRADS